jgi:hypothetical protein
VERRDLRGHYEELAAEYDEHGMNRPGGGSHRAEFVIRLDQPDPAEYYR